VIAADEIVNFLNKFQLLFRFFLKVCCKRTGITHTACYVAVLVKITS